MMEEFEYECYVSQDNEEFYIEITLHEDKAILMEKLLIYVKHKLYY